MCVAVSLVLALPAWVDAHQRCVSAGCVASQVYIGPLSEPIVGSHAVTSPTIYTHLYGACCIKLKYIVVRLAAGLGLSGSSDFTLLVASTLTLLCCLVVFTAGAPN
jgi:hypothetical protein